jgi:FkbM family methyltransferase
MSNTFIKNTAYSLLDILTFKKGIVRHINGMKIRFTPRWSRYFKDNYEQENYQFVKDQVKQGMQIIDIGAHIGLFSVCTSQLVGPSGKIISFEPTLGTFDLLKNTLRLNDCTNVIPRDEAVGSTPGKATFYVSDAIAGCNSNSLVKINEKGQAGYEVTITTIDNICRDYNLKPGLVKIDVEGAELDVLKGATNTLKTARPLIILGLHPGFIKTKGDSLKEIWDVLTGNNYKVTLGGQEMSEHEFISQDDLFDVQLFPR